MSNTSNLKLPLVQGTDYVTKESINALAEAVDNAALPVSHLQDRAHWEKWEASKIYQLKDVVS